MSLNWTTGDFFVFGNRGTYINAKYLRDSNGNFIVNPNSLNGEPYKVQANFDFTAFQARYASISGLSAIPVFIQNWVHNAKDDYQRINGEFYGDFTDSTSFLLGVASETSNLSVVAPLAGGGFFNLMNYISNDTIKLSWVFGNTPDNVVSIWNGYSYGLDPNSVAKGYMQDYSAVSSFGTVSVTRATATNKKSTIVIAAANQAPITYSIETTTLGGSESASEFTVTSITNQTTGNVSYEIRHGGTGDLIASGANYAVNPNNTITTTTTTGTLQTTDLSNGKFLYQVQPDGSGLVAGPGGNDVYFGAGDTVTKTPNGVHIEFAAGGSTDVDTDVYGNPEITKTDIDGNRVIQSFNPDGTVAFTLERPAGFTPNNAVESLDDTMRSINMINASIGLTQTGTEPATAIQTITFDDGSTLTFGTDPATGQAVLSSTPSTDTTVGSGAGAGQYGTSTSSTISIAPNGTTQVTYNYAAGGSLIATTTTGGETVYTATTGVNTSPEGQPSNANVVYSVWTDSSGTPIVAGDGLAANEVATEQAGSLPAWNTKKCRMNQIFRSNNACSRRISYLRRYQKYKTRKFFHAKLQHMNVTAEIKTGQRRVIEYLLSPVQRAGGESLRER
jgi:hypothetical protein